MSTPTSLHLSRTDADVFVPDGVAIPSALARVERLAVVAHQDDAEWIGLHGILSAFDGEPSFGAVVVTDGAGSPRGGPYADVDDATMCTIRREEQRRAALVGRYALCVQLAHPSAAVRDPSNGDSTRDLVSILRATAPRTVYLHAPTDRHETHVAVCVRTLEALRRVDRESGGRVRPERVLGVEGWGDLDWLAAQDRVALDVGARPHLVAALVGVFDSQIEGGKRYDLAMRARHVANATFGAPREVDRCVALALAVDLTAVARDGGPDVRALVDGLLERSAQGVRERLGRVHPS
ncbi:MAG: PIG-L family deacetylase [Planctomycetota bacterium]